MINLTFIRAADGTPLVKKFTRQSVSSYPRVRYLNSVELENTDAPIWAEAMVTTLREKADNGWAMMKGPFVQQLQSQSRAGLTNKIAATRLVVIDIDGLKLPTWKHSDKVTKQDLRHVSELVLRYMPDFLREATYISNASASMGIKDSINLHLFFLLDEEISPKDLKIFLTLLNFQSESIRMQVGLTKSGTALTFPIDRALADNSRIIYIGTPQFSRDMNPVEERFIVVQKDEPYIERKRLRSFVREQRKAHLQVAETVAALREASGLPPKTGKVFNLVDAEGHQQRVVINPDRMTMTLVSESDEFARFNVGEGDSNAYWVHKRDPRIVHNFKGEPPFLFSEADPEAYVDFCEQWNVGTLSEQKVWFPFLDISSNKFRAVEIDPTSSTVLGDPREYTIQTLDHLLRHNGQELPDPIPAMNYTFDPHEPRSLDMENDFINRFRMPPMLAEPTVIDDAFMECPYEYSADALQALCPTIHKVINSITGCGKAEYLHFVNWLAFIVQRLDRTGTAWLFHGCQGTGKGILFHNVLTPILTTEYTKMVNQRDIQDRFNAWRTSTFLIAGDEVRFNRGRTGDEQINLLKNAITEPVISSREMRSIVVEATNYNNWMFFTNDRDSMPIDDNGRRFNICPRQDTPLVERYKEYRKGDTLLKELEEQTPRFAAFLHAFEIDTNAVRRPLDSEAKMELIQVSRSPMDVVAGVIETGVIDPLLDLYETEGNDVTDTSLLMAKELIRVALLHIDTNLGRIAGPRDSLCHRSIDFYHLYVSLSGNDTMPQAKFMQNMRSRGDRLRPKEGMRHRITQPEHTGKAFRGYRVYWKCGKEAERVAWLQRDAVQTTKKLLGNTPMWLQELLDMGHINMEEE